MAECTECGEYTKYNGGLCTRCYNKTKYASAGHSVEIFMEKEDTREWQIGRKYDMIKGRIAETLIQELFLSLNYNVFRYGMENTIPEVMKLLKGVYTDVAETIRRMPDFVMQNPRTKDIYFVEVKFRANESFSVKDLPKDYPYGNVYIILVSKKHIKCITVQELKEGKEITPTSHNYLGNRTEFALDKDVIIDFCNFAVMFFEHVQ